ncbi:uncharacterized protein LOC119929746 isoform X2 [Tachyglossus aculeatus]|uniref:uncharacterized protein LOC119929746 isoform X2 n=1 Tax=Tachyglossus aculeatus TaxID=9261 RepID=UPI0018F46722|nr:uncharacterized protein LOC119929746 isoform X2 [Tachyglossus aculeatus]
MQNSAQVFFPSILLLMLKDFSPVSATERLEKRIFAAVGSSVLFPAPEIKPSLTIIQWEFINDYPLQLIVEYEVNSSKAIVYEPYKGRVDFNESTGYLLLKNVQKKDSGVYKIVINLMEKEAQKVTLTVIEPVTQPQLRSNLSLDGSALWLSCDVSGDRITIVWKKNEQPIPPEECYQLSVDQKHLGIINLEKSDCGNFSCNASNEISWKQATVDVTFEGIPAAFQHAQKMSAVALMLGIIAAVSFISLCCQSTKPKPDGEEWRYFICFLQAMVCLSSVLLFAVTIIWMAQQGVSVFLIFLILALNWVMMVTLVILAVLVWDPKRLRPFTYRRPIRIILDATAPGGVILVMVLAGFFLMNIHDLQEKGCSSKDMTASFIVPLVLSLIPFLFFLLYHIKRKKKRGETWNYPAGTEDDQTSLPALPALSARQRSLPEDPSHGPQALEQQRVRNYEREET